MRWKQCSSESVEVNSKSTPLNVFDLPGGLKVNVTASVLFEFLGCCFHTDGFSFHVCFDQRRFVGETGSVVPEVAHNKNVNSRFGRRTMCTIICLWRRYGTHRKHLPKSIVSCCGRLGVLPSVLRDAQVGDGRKR